ncbi:unnamed protein product, partial [Amoebophrya sp. A25]
EKTASPSQHRSKTKKNDQKPSSKSRHGESKDRKKDRTRGENNGTKVAQDQKNRHDKQSEHGDRHHDHHHHRHHHHIIAPTGGIRQRDSRPMKRSMILAGKNKKVKQWDTPKLDPAALMTSRAGRVRKSDLVRAELAGLKKGHEERLNRCRNDFLDTLQKVTKVVLDELTKRGPELKDYARKQGYCQYADAGTRWGEIMVREPEQYMAEKDDAVKKE